METLKKVHNTSLAEYISIYLRHSKSTEQYDKTESILFNQVKSIITDMRDSGVVSAIIFSYILTVTQMLTFDQRFNIVEDYKRVEAMLGLLYDDEITKKKHLAQLISYVTKSNMNVSKMPHLQEKLHEIIAATI